MTNREKLKEIFPNIILIGTVMIYKPTEQVLASSINYNWLDAEYKESTTKNDLGVDCIDKAELLKAMDTWDKFGYSTRYGLERLDKDDKDFAPYIHYNDMLKAVNGMSTVEAVPKEQYEARLKAHLVAILEDIQLEIEEIVKEGKTN